MSKWVNKVLKKVSPIANKLSFGATGIADNMLDKYAGTDIGGFKAAQAEAQQAEANRNQMALNAQLNANTIGAQGTDNITQLEAGGTAAASTSTSTDLKKRKGASISSTLGL